MQVHMSIIGKGRGFILSSPVLQSTKLPRQKQEKERKEYYRLTTDIDTFSSMYLGETVIVI